MPSTDKKKWKTKQNKQTQKQKNSRFGKHIPKRLFALRWNVNWKTKAKNKNKKYSLQLYVCNCMFAEWKSLQKANYRIVENKRIQNQFFEMHFNFKKS